MARRSLLLLPLLALLALAAVAPLAQAAIPPPDGSFAWVQMQFVEISKIDGVEQAFRADFYMLTTWATDNSVHKYNVSDEIGKDELLANLWAPQLEFINARDEVTRLVDEPFAFCPPDEMLFIPMAPNPITGNMDLFTLGPDQIWVTEDQRYQCDFTTPLAMQDFPFDRQFMELLIESYWDATQLKIIWAEPDKIGNLLPSTMPSIVGWEQIEQGYFSKDIEYQYNTRDYNRLTIRAMLEREPFYYMTKIVAGSMLLVYMGIWVFSLAVDEADRMMGTLTVFGGLVTFLFVAAGDTPKVPYQTRLDKFMLFSFFNVAVMLIAHGALYYWREADDLVSKYLEEKHDARVAMGLDGAGDAGGKDAVRPVSGSDIELAQNPASPSIHVKPAGAFVSDESLGVKPEVARIPSLRRRPSEFDVRPHWFLRLSPWRDFTFGGWWRGLHRTRKWDAIIIPALALCYSIGCAIILGGPRQKNPDLYDP